MGRLSAVFKADGAESANRYSISEWWLDPHTKGPGVHQHPEDDLFYVLGGTLHVLVDTDWIEATVGSFVLVPGHSPRLREPRPRACRFPQCVGARRVRASHAQHRRLVPRPFGRGQPSLTTPGRTRRDIAGANTTEAQPKVKAHKSLSRRTRQPAILRAKEGPKRAGRCGTENGLSDW